MDSPAGSRRAPLLTQTPSNTSRSRSFSDTAATPPNGLAPSPNIRESSKDDHHAALLSTPTTSRRLDSRARGLALHMPDSVAAAAAMTRLDMPSPSQFPRPVPLSPKLDKHEIFMQQSNSLAGSPVTSLPRHSRGLDFARACTNLHHSTLAEQSSPDASPTITQKGMAIPGRKSSMSSMMLDSPALTSHGWGSIHERGTLSSSMGSAMMVSESESSDSDDDAIMGGDETDDPMFATPQVHKLQNPNTAVTPFALSTVSNADGVGSWGIGSMFSPAQSSLMRTIRRSGVHKSRLHIRKKASSTTSSAIASPRATSPPPISSIENATNCGYFQWARQRGRKGSLAMGTDNLNLSSGNDSGDEASHSTTPPTPSVVRRPVTRRANLLPKTKGFARIRAALAEEAAPIDTEARREAETVRQVRERDGSVTEFDLNYDPNRQKTTTAQSSPSLLPAVMESIQEDFGRELDDCRGGTRGLGTNFATHASRNSGGRDYWNRFDPGSMRTPPPPSHRTESANDTDSNSTLWRRPRAQSSTSEASDAFGPSSSSNNHNNNAKPSAVNDDLHLKKFKRRREDDFDIATIKRRAVSPGISAQNSPVLVHSPSQRDVSFAWGQPPDRLLREGQSAGVNSDLSQTSQNLQALQTGKPLPPPRQISRNGSGGSTTSQTSGSVAVTNAGGSNTNLASQGKKLGLQGMTDTNDGLMKMTIE